MRIFGRSPNRLIRSSSYLLWCAVATAGLLTLLPIQRISAQTVSQENSTQQIMQLTDAMSRVEAELAESQRQLAEMRRQLAALQQQLREHQSGPSTTAAESSPVPTLPDLQDLSERQAIQEAQIKTHEQTKVETESKYPVKITGLLLLNGFVNTRAVDMPATPTLAIPGGGSTGASVRQTVLGIDAQGPHLFGASSYADLRVDFNGSSQTGGTAGTYSGYYNASGSFLRLRTAHAGLRWKNSEAFFSLDRPIFSPDSPSSLTAIAEPALAWSGTLWTWNPQIGYNHDLELRGAHGLRLQAALIDVADAPINPVPPATTSTPSIQPTSSETSRWPGVEARIALLGAPHDPNSNHLGIGGYFSPHVGPLDRRYDAWAATLDARLNLPAHLEFTGSFYRGQALGGLGAGDYKDIAYHMDTGTGRYFVKPLADVGGWAQLKSRLSERLELNAAFGLDNVFAHPLRLYAFPGNTIYEDLARNRTYTGNVIYSPSAYLQFSLEYRNLRSIPVVGSPAASNVIGLAAGYKF